MTSAAGAVFAQNLLVNGSFETETAANGNGRYQLTSTAAPNGWSFAPSAVTSDAIATTYYTAQDGTWSIQMGALGDPYSDSNPSQSSYDSLQQSVQTTAGGTYTLSYWLRDFDTAAGSFVFNATWNGAVIAGTQESLNIPNTWTEYTATVTGTGGMATLGLNGYDALAYGGLDNVSLVQSQVAPSPSGLPITVFTIGLGAAGFIALRRRSA